MNKDLNFFDELRDIIKLYKDGSEEPLDGDEVDRLVKHLKNQINLIEGNITEEEYDKEENDK
jgi:hypothetical protein